MRPSGASSAIGMPAFWDGHNFLPVKTSQIIKKETNLTSRTPKTYVPVQWSSRTVLLTHEWDTFRTISAAVPNVERHPDVTHPDL